MPKNPRWDFRLMERGEMNADPVHDEFFNTEALDSLAAPLVREFNQNALDARESSQQVYVRIVFGNNGWELSPHTAAPYMAGLREHLEAENSGLRREMLPLPDEPMRFLAIEDFGTRGLLGDPARDDEDSLLAAGERNDFFYFWRNLGRSRKAENERGRWGLGHAVFANASRVNSFLGVTVRSDDRKTLLLGQSVLKIHRANGKKFCPYGWFGNFAGDSFAMPVEDGPLLDQMCDHFHLQRHGKPGLSVVIPFPDPTIEPEVVARALIGHYFYPILTSALKIQLVGSNSSDVLDRQNIRAAARSLFGTTDQTRLEGLLRVFDLVEWSLTLKAEDLASPEELPTTKAPSWENVVFPDEVLTEVREAYETRKQMALSIPVKVQEKKQQPKPASFRVLMERDPQVERGEIHFVRQGITILNPNVARERSVRAVVVVEDSDLSKLLGDAENPAHTEWQERSPKFRNKYNHGPSCLRFVKNTVRGIVRILTAASEERDKDLLRDLFFVTKPAEEGGDGGDGTDGTKRRKTKGPPDGPGIPRPPRIAKIDRVVGGFKVIGHPEAPDQARLFDVRLAYAVRKGNPFKRYLPEDFRVDSQAIVIESGGVLVTTRTENHLAFETQGKNFSVKVTGFDPHRDLVIRLTHSEVAA